LIDHVILNVSDFEASERFYAAALGALGFTPGMEFEGMRAYDLDGRPWFWIVHRGEPARGTHVAFPARSRADVDAFHAAALAAGGRDNGAPGVREDYHANYFAAFALDPDGNNIEAVIHAPG
jgi:catechol 2,3-dioxygenase-like lactoylglutathione lyase family enzyme